METAPALDLGRILLGDLLRVALQRAFAEDWDAVSPRPPRSYGLLPAVPWETAGGLSAFAAPLLPGEVVWIGLEPLDPRRSVRVEVAPSAGPPLPPLFSPPAFALKGLPADAGWRPFGGSGRDGPPNWIDLVARGQDACRGEGRARLLFLPMSDIERRHGLADVAPLRRDDGFTGVRLP